MTTIDLETWGTVWEPIFQAAGMPDVRQLQDGVFTNEQIASLSPDPDTLEKFFAKFQPSIGSDVKRWITSLTLRCSHGMDTSMLVPDEIQEENMLYSELNTYEHEMDVYRAMLVC